MDSTNSTPVRALAAILLLLAGAILPLGCGEPPPPPPELSGPAEPAYGDAIVEGSIGDASNLIPYIASDVSSSEVTGWSTTAWSSSTKTWTSNLPWPKAGR